MKCEFCGSELETAYLLPWPDGTRDVSGHRACGIKNGVFCAIHEERHTLFASGGTACLTCIEDAVQTNKHRADEIYSRIAAHLPEGDLADIEKWAVSVRRIMGDESTSVSVLRSIMTQVKRSGSSVEEAVQNVIRSGSADLLLPF